MCMGDQEDHHPFATNVFGSLSPLYFEDTVSYDTFLAFSMVLTPWTVTLAHYLKMGGLRLACTEEENTEGRMDSVPSENVEFTGRRIKSRGFIHPYPRNLD